MRNILSQPAIWGKLIDFYVDEIIYTVTRDWK